MYVYVINLITLCHSYVLMCCSDSMDNYVWGCLCIEVIFLTMLYWFDLSIAIWGLSSLRCILLQWVACI
jgi:hypothetical protein